MYRLKKIQKVYELLRDEPTLACMSDHELRESAGKLVTIAAKSEPEDSHHRFAHGG